MKFTQKINKAIMIAAKAHEGQERKTDSTPYISHPFAVAMILSKYTDDENIIIAGLLHDILEDVKSDIYTEDKMLEDFGEKVVEIVKEVSEDKDPDIVTNEKETWQARKEKYLEDLTKDSISAVMVSAADKIHNLMSLKISHDELGDEVWKKFNASKDQKKWFYSEVVKICKERLDSHIVKELEKEFQQSPLVLNTDGEAADKTEGKPAKKLLILLKPGLNETKEKFKERIIEELKKKGLFQNEKK